jgi:hypothetical protein
MTLHMIGRSTKTRLEPTSMACVADRWELRSDAFDGTSLSFPSLLTVPQPF